MALKFSYFPVFAKGPSCALALAHSGLEWEGCTVEFEAWPAMKPSTPWRSVPVLTLPDGTTIGHEIAILNYIGRRAPAMAGESDRDFATSQQLLQEAEDIYAKLVALQPTILAKDKPTDKVDAFWSKSDATSHNAQFGLSVFLNLLEDFYKSCAAGEGRFTDGGASVGECSLFAKLHMLVMIKEDLLEAYPGLASFYSRFLLEPQTQDIVKAGGKMQKPFAQYFIAASPETAVSTVASPLRKRRLICW